jgi:hypothetical protein
MDIGLVEIQYYGCCVVDLHNRVLPHSAFRGQTPNEMYFGAGSTVPDDLTSGATAARRARRDANRSASCDTCRLN